MEQNTEAQVQPVDTCRVEIKQTAKGDAQVSVRATDKATQEEADRAVNMALKMYGDVLRGL